MSNPVRPVSLPVTDADGNKVFTGVDHGLIILRTGWHTPNRIAARLTPEQAGELAGLLRVARVEAREYEGDDDGA